MTTAVDPRFRAGDRRPSRPILVDLEEIGPQAADWLRTPRPAQVLHRTRRACHLVDAQRRVLSLVHADADLGPFSARVPARAASRLRGVAADARAFVTASGLRLGEILLTASKTRIVDARPNWAALRGRPDLLTAALPAIEGELDRGPPIEVAMRDAARLLAGAVVSDRRAENALCALAGSGGGLTPAGDDLIVGITYAAWATDLDFLAAAAEAAKAAAGRTATLSASWLRAAARGDAARPWHDLARAVVAGDPAAAARLVLAIGSSTGACSLTGFVLGATRMCELREAS